MDQRSQRGRRLAGWSAGTISGWGIGGWTSGCVRVDFVLRRGAGGDTGAAYRAEMAWATGAERCFAVHTVGIARGGFSGWFGGEYSRLESRRWMEETG